MPITYEQKKEIKAIDAAIETLEEYRDNKIATCDVDRVKIDLANSYHKLKKNQELNAQAYNLQQKANSQAANQPAIEHYIACANTEKAPKVGETSEHIEKTGKLTKQWWIELRDAISSQFYVQCTSEINKAIQLLTASKKQLESKKTATNPHRSETAEPEQSLGKEESAPRVSSLQQTNESQNTIKKAPEEKLQDSEEKTIHQEEETLHTLINQHTESCKEIIKKIKTSIMGSEFKLTGIHDDIDNLFSNIKYNNKMALSNCTAHTATLTGRSAHHKKTRQYANGDEKSTVWHADEKLCAPLNECIGIAKHIRSEFSSHACSIERYKEQRSELHKRLEKTSFIIMFGKKYRIITPMSLMVLHQALDEYLLDMINESKLDHILTQVTSPYFDRNRIKQSEADQKKALAKQCPETAISWGIEYSEKTLLVKQKTLPKKPVKHNYCFASTNTETELAECVRLFENYLTYKKLSADTQFKINDAVGNPMSAECFTRLLEADRIRQWLIYYQEVIEKLNEKLGHEPAKNIIEQLTAILEDAIGRTTKPGNANQKPHEDEEKISYGEEKPIQSAPPRKSTNPENALLAHLVDTLSSKREEIPNQPMMNDDLVELYSICYGTGQLINPWREKDTAGAKAKQKALLKLKHKTQDYQNQFASVLLMDMVTLEDLDYDSMTHAIESTFDKMQTKTDQQSRTTKRTSTLIRINTISKDDFLLNGLAPSKKLCVSLARELLPCFNQLTSTLSDYHSSSFDIKRFYALITRLKKFTTIMEKAKESLDTQYQDSQHNVTDLSVEEENSIRPTTPKAHHRKPQPPARKKQTAPPPRKTGKTEDDESITNNRSTTFTKSHTEEQHETDISLTAVNIVSQNA